MRRRVLMGFLLTCLGAPYAPAQDRSPTEADADGSSVVLRDSSAFLTRLSILEASDLDTAGPAFSEATYSAYLPLREFITPIRLTSLSDREVIQLYRAQEIAVFYTNYLELTSDVVALSNEMTSRNLLTKERRTSLESSLVRLRAFDHAARMRAGDSSSAFPKVLTSADWNAQLPSVIQALDSPQEFAIRNLDTSKVKLLMTYGPYCKPSKRALQALLNDPDIAKDFAASTAIILPVDGVLYHQEMRSIQRMPNAPLVGIAYNRKDWPFVSTWRTPVFYFLENEKVVRKIEGWPEGGRMEEFRAAYHLVVRQ